MLKDLILPLIWLKSFKFWGGVLGVGSTKDLPSGVYTIEPGGGFSY